MTQDLPDPGCRPDPSDLRADCSRCVGLCCVAPAFAASADFAIDKPAGQPCPHLGDDFGCTIHQDLRARGFPGCTVFDCFGAGQKVVQLTFAGQDWRHSREVAARMFDTFTVMRQLHELLWYLSTARALPLARQLVSELDVALVETDRLTGRTAAELVAMDVEAHRAAVNELLRRVSSRVRTGERRRPADLSGADLIGKDLRRSDLRAASLRGAYLIGADLRGVDLRLTDVTGADLRGADLRGADLTDSLFLTQAQVDAARGDTATRLGRSLVRPAHWPT